MRVEITRELLPLQRFLYWMKERHRIYLRRFVAGETKPWTDDEVLQTVFFTNPFRELDKVTVWVRENIREPYACNPNLWFMLCIARQLNRPETLQHMMDRKVWPIGNRWEAVRAAKVLNEWKEAGNAIYTGAYMIAAPSGNNPHRALPSKQHYITRIVLGGVWEDRRKWEFVVRKQNSIQATTEWLSEHTGWGGFLSYEVACDLLYTCDLRDAEDRMIWANPGPGAYRGLNWLAGVDVTTTRPKSEAIRCMQDLLGVVRKADPCPKPHPPYDMRTIEHSLCEFDKYSRALFKTGRLKRMYQGR